jgi:hypothetical protein
LVIEAMTGDLVARIMDGPHEPGGALSHPAKHEERRSDTTLGEQLEQARRIAFNAIVECVPLRAVNSAGEGRGMEVVLDVDR